MHDGVPDCPKCASDSAFGDWLQAHRYDAVEVDRRTKADIEVFDLLRPHMNAADARRLAERIVPVVERHQQVTVWAHWADMILRRAAQSTSEEQG